MTPPSPPLRSTEGATHRAVWVIAVRNARRRSLRSFALGVPLAIATALLYAAVVVVDGIVADAHLANAALPDLLLQHLERGELRPIEVDPIARALEPLPEVRRVTGREWALVPAPGEESAGALAVLVGDAGPSAGHPPTGHWRDVLEAPAHPSAEGWESGSVPPGHVVVGPGLARLGQLVAGDTWQVKGAAKSMPLEVDGVLRSETAVFSANLALVHPNTLQELDGLTPGWATEVAIDLDDPAQARQTAEVLVRAFPHLRIVERRATDRLTDVVYGDRLGRWAALWLILLAVPVALAFALGLDVAASERRELGILKALGWPSLLLVELKVAEAAFIGIAATAAGMVAGLSYVAMDAPGLAAFFVGWAELYPDFPLPLALRWDSAFAVVAVGTVPLVAASALPAWRIGTQSPDAAMRE